MWVTQVLQKYHFRAQTGATKKHSFSSLYFCTKGHPHPPPIPEEPVSNLSPSQVV